MGTRHQYPSMISDAKHCHFDAEGYNQDDGSFILYYSASTATDPTKHCVGAATAKSILGPYTAQPDALFCPLAEGGAIDAAG